ncbi:hypothetical protein SANTM175S_01753 [Streptomyces antimycoticus]
MPLLHRLVVTAALTTAATAGALAPAGATPLPLPLPLDGESADRLVITVSQNGEPDDASTFVLSCHPTGGTHPRARAACAQLDSQTVGAGLRSRRCRPMRCAPGSTAGRPRLG